MKTPELVQEKERARIAYEADFGVRPEEAPGIVYGGFSRAEVWDLKLEAFEAGAAYASEGCRETTQPSETRGDLDAFFKSLHCCDEHCSGCAHDRDAIRALVSQTGHEAYLRGRADTWEEAAQFVEGLWRKMLSPEDAEAAASALREKIAK